jgi:PAS domain S-box-containing protein
MPTILIIDDEKDIRELARWVLAQEGYTVLAESSANAGIATARRQPPDLILMDLNLPQVDGWTATRVIKSDPILAHIPVIAWTALNIPGGESGARAAGYDGYLPKPVDLSRFVEQVVSLLPERSRKPESPPPLAQQPAVSPPIAIIPSFLTEVRLLLVANEVTRQEIHQRLSSAGYRQILQAADVPGALETTRSNRLDLILVDLDESGADGLATVEQLRSGPHLATAPAIFVVIAQAPQADALRELGFSADDYIFKPIHWEELAARLSSRLRIKLLEDYLNRQQANLEVLYRASQMLSASLDLSTVLTTILEQTVISVGATGGVLYLLDANRRPLDQLSTGDMALNLPKEKLEAIFERGAAGWALSHLEPAVINDTSIDPRWVKTEEGGRVRSAIIVPLVGRGGVPGLLVLNHNELGHFTQEHIAVLSSLAAQAAISLDNARLFAQARNERQKLLAILDSSADAVVVVDNNMRITLVSPVAEQLLGLSESTVGCSVKEALALSPLPGLFELAASRGDPISLELNIRGGVYHASIRPVPGVGYVALLQDIHLLKEIEKMERERERQETERLRREFARHMSPQVVRLLLKRGETLVPRKRMAAVLFSDLRNFSGLTERMGIEVMLEFVLKRYITAMTDIVYAHEGTIDKFLGDGIMAVFGVPFPQADAPHRALSTAMIMLRALTMLRAGWLRDLNQDISMGIGLAWGEVIAGDIGSSQRTDYTVIGEPVNTAARLGDLASPGEVLVSQSLVEAVGGDSSEWRMEALPPITLKGKDQPQRIYRAVPIWPELETDNV